MLVNTICRVGGSFVKKEAALTMRKVLGYKFRLVPGNDIL
jgi:hypothetical protein